MPSPKSPSTPPSGSKVLVTVPGTGPIPDAVPAYIIFWPKEWRETVNAALPALIAQYGANSSPENIVKEAGKYADLVAEEQRKRTYGKS